MPYLYKYPAATNAAFRSNDLASTPWVSRNGGSATFNQVGLTGAPNTASLLTATAVGGLIDTYQPVTLVADTNPHTIKIWVRKEAAANIRGVLITLTITADYKYVLNTGTGVLTLVSGAATATEVAGIGNWWCVHIQAPSQSTTTGYMVIQSGYNADGSAIANPQIGHAIIGNAEWYVNKVIAEVRSLGPIFTTTAAVATVETRYSFDVANLNRNGSVWYHENIPYDFPAGIAVNSGGGSIMLENYYTGYLMAITNPNTLRIPPSQINYGVFGTVMKMATLGSVADNKCICNFNGTYAPEGAWPNPIPGIGPINIGPNSTVGWQVRNLRSYAITSFANGKTIIDGLMTP
jgi:hypothetical protein